jgi:hypothetical protein
LAVWSHVGPDLADEQAFEAADDLGFGLAFGESSCHVGLGGFVVLHADDDGAIERGVRVAVPAAVQAVAGGLSRRGRDRGDAAKLGERGLGADALGIVARNDDHFRGDVGADTERRDKVGGGLLAEFAEDLLVCLDLGVELEPATRDGAQRVLARRDEVDDLPGSQGGAATDEGL